MIPVAKFIVPVPFPESDRFGLEPEGHLWLYVVSASGLSQVQMALTRCCDHFKLLTKLGKGKAMVGSICK